MDELQPTEAASLRTLLQIIARRFAWLLVVTFLILAAALAFVSIQTKRYSASADLLVQPTNGSIPTTGTQQTISQTEVLTELQLITNTPVKVRAANKLGFTPDISAAEVGQTDEISLTATARSPVLAARVANVYATTFVDYERTDALDDLVTAEDQLERQIASLAAQLEPLLAETTPSGATMSTISSLSNQEAVLKGQLAEIQVTGAETPGGVEVVSPASPPTLPSSPKPLRDEGIALVIGLLLGLGAAFAAEYFDDKIYTKEEAEERSGGVSVVTIIPRVKSWKRSKRPYLITEVDPFSPVSEAYRTLRTSLLFAGHDKQLKTILVTSPSGAEGKTSTVANLGIVLAETGEQVVVVSCDLRRPRVGEFFGQKDVPGFTSVSLGRKDLKEALQSVSSRPGLTLLDSGPTPPNPAELLSSDSAAEIFRRLSVDYEMVLIDSPPVMPVSDPLVLSRYADGVLMVVMVGQTTQAELQRGVELLAQVNVRPIGIVLNKATRRSAKGSNSRYGYRYRYHPVDVQVTP